VRAPPPLQSGRRGSLSQDPGLASPSGLTAHCYIFSVPPLISAASIVRRFGSVAALSGVDLEVAAGEAVLLLGANGAGKTTLLRVLAGLSRPNRGTVRIGGHDLLASAEARRQVGFVSHSALLYEDLTPRENLRFTASLHGLDDCASRVSRALEVAGLSHRADRPVRGFSRGMMQRLALARATLHEPEVLLLDEPFTGLDAEASRLLVARVAADRSAGRAIVAVTHDPEELWQVANRVVLLERGKVIFDGPRPDDPADVHSLQPAVDG
jgi:heme exporter protein A